MDPFDEITFWNDFPPKKQKPRCFEFSRQITIWILLDSQPHLKIYYFYNNFHLFFQGRQPGTVSTWSISGLKFEFPAKAKQKMPPFKRDVFLVKSQYDHF